MKNFKVKIIAGILALMIIILLILSGPAQAFILGLSISNKNVNQGEKINIVVNAQIEQGETKDINYFILNISGPSKISCIFYPNNTKISGCDLLTIENISSTSYRYGYGYLSGNISYKVTLDTSSLNPGSYSTKLTALISGQEQIIDGDNFSLSSFQCPQGQELCSDGACRDKCSSSGGSGGGGGGGGGGSVILSINNTQEIQNVSNITSINENSASTQACIEDWKCYWSECRQEQDKYYSYPESCTDKNDCNTKDNLPEKIECYNESQSQDSQVYSTGILGKVISPLNNINSDNPILLLIVGILFPLIGLLILVPIYLRKRKTGLISAA